MRWCFSDVRPDKHLSERAHGAGLSPSFQSRLKGQVLWPDAPSRSGPLFLPIDRHGNLGLNAAGRRTETGRIADDYPEKAMARAFARIGVEVTGHSGHRSYITR